jgi:hypothetical protein
VDGVPDGAEKAADLGIGQGLRQSLLTGLTNLFSQTAASRAPASGSTESGSRNDTKAVKF